MEKCIANITKYHAWVVLSDGRHVATIHSQCARSTCTVEVYHTSSIAMQRGKSRYGGETAALQGLTIGGYRLYDHAMQCRELGEGPWPVGTVPPRGAGSIRT